ncbi:MAG: hypothetical protein AB1689_16705 [Thermodesulfobacteriota bacterium]
MNRSSRVAQARAAVAVAVSALAFVVACKRPAEVRITSPTHGTFFSQAVDTIAVDGTILEVDPADARVAVNGVAAELDVASRTFRAFVPTVAGEVFQPLLAEMTQLSTGKVFRNRVVVVTGPMRPDALAIPNGFGLRILQSGLDDLSPVVAALIEQQLDLAALLPSSFESDGATITVLTNPPASFGGLTLALDASAGRLDVTGALDGVSVDLRIDKDGIFGGVHCSMEVDVDELTVTTHQQLAPSSDGSSIAVRQVAVDGAEVAVAFSGLTSLVDCESSGLFEKAKENRVRDKLQASLATALAAFLEGPDGTGPEDAPIAAAVEGQLAALEVGRLAVPGLASEIEASFASIDELAIGLQSFLHVDADPRISLRTPALGGVAALPARPDPDLPGSLLVPASAPVLTSILLHDASFAISLSAINRLLMSETEARRFETVIDEVDGQPLVAASLSDELPELEALPPDTPLRVKIKPTLAPVVTANAGPLGETLELQIADVLVSLVKLVQTDGPSKEEELLRAALDARLGVSVAAAADGGISASLGTVAGENLRVLILANQLGTSAAGLEIVAPFVLANQIPQLVTTTIGFPLPSFVDLDLDAVAVQRQPGHLVVFTKLEPTP